MKTRRMGMITALLLTAALFLVLPGLMRTLLARDFSRADDSLRPPKLRTLAVWLIPGELDDRRLIASACAAFEQQHPGVRVFLRSVGAGELHQPDAVLPDAVLFETGAVSVPEKVFLPLADASAPSGMHAGVCYALPLWLSPNVLSIPAQWMQAEAQATPVPGSLLGAAPPQMQIQQQLSAEDLPWPAIAQSLQRPQGTALQQLLSMCPAALRPALLQSESGEAQVLSLRAFLSGAQDACGVVLTPAVSDRVRMGALCRQSAEASAFLRFLQQQTAQEAAAHGLICPGQPAEAADGWTQQAAELFASTYTLPNAFAHTREELSQLCLQGFLRMDDPVMTLLRLR